MTRTARILLVVATLGAPASSWATSFVYDGGAVAVPKADYQVNPSIPSNQKIVAADWNQLGQAVYDLRTALTWGYFVGFAPQTAAPPAPASGVIVFEMADGGAIYGEYPDGGMFQVAGGAAMGFSADVNVGGALEANTLISDNDINYSGDLTGPSGFSVSGGLVSAPSTLIGAANETTATVGALTVTGASFVDGGETVDHLYAKGAIGADGGFVGNAMTANGSTAGLTITSNVTDALGHIGVVVNNTTALTLSTDGVFRVKNGSTNELTVQGNGVTWSNNGFDADSSKVVNVANGSSDTDAAAMGQKIAGSIAGTNPTGYTPGTAFATQIASLPGSILEVGVTAVVQSSSTNTNGDAVFEIYDATTTTDLLDVTYSCDCSQVSGPCSKTGPGGSHGDGGNVTINSGDTIQIILKTDPCAAAGSYNVNAWWR